MHSLWKPYIHYKIIMGFMFLSVKKGFLSTAEKCKQWIIHFFSNKI